MITQSRNQVIESDGEESGLNSLFHNLSGLINIKPLLASDTGVQQAESHDVEHVLAIECYLQSYVRV